MRTPGGQSQGATRPRPAVPRPATRPEDSGTRPSWPRALARSRLPRVGVSPGRAVYTNRARRGEFADRRCGVGSDTVSSAASCGREPRGTRQRTATALSSGAQLLPRERGCSDRLPEDSRRASARHRRPSAPGADPREHSRPPRAAAADPHTPLGSCSRHPATLPARGRLPSDTTCPSERTEEKQTDFK